MKDWIAYYRKAIAGVFGAAILAFAAAMFLSSPGHITDNEWFLIISALVGGGAAPAITPKNGPKPVKGEGGQADVGLILLCLTFVGVVLLLFRVHFGG